MSAMQQLLLLCGAVLGPLFIVVFFIEGALRKGYYPVRQPVSSLAIGPRGWIQQANFFIAAALSLAYALGLHLALGGIAGSIEFPLLVAVIGLGLLGAGVFVTDVTGLPEDRSQLTKRSRNGRLHDLAGVPVFGLIFVSFFVYSYLSIEAGHWGFAIVSVLCALVFAPSFVLAGAGFAGAPKFASYGGLFQRIAICVGFIWLSIVAVALIGGLWGQGDLRSTTQSALASLQADLENVAPQVVNASQAVDAQPPTPQEQKIKDDVVALLLASQPDNTDFYSQLWIDAIGRRYVLVTQPIAESSYDEVIDSQTGTVTPIPESARYDLEPLAPSRNAMLYIDAQHIYLYTLDQPAPTLVPGSALSGTETYTSGEADTPSIIPRMSYTPDSITITVFDTSKRVPNPKLGVGTMMNGAVREATFSF